MKKKKILILIFVILTLILAFKVLNVNANITKLPPANIINIEKGNIEFTYDVEGIVESEKEVLIFSNLIGKVNKVYHRLGDEVKKGDILLEIDGSSLNEISNNIEKARISVLQKEKEYNDLLEIYKLGGASKLEIENALNSLKIARLDLNSLQSASSEFSNTIKSTVSGVIIESNVDENLKIDQSKYLFKIVDLDNLKISAEIPNSKVKYLKEKDLVKITSSSLEDGKVLESDIKEIGKISYKSTSFNDSVTKIIVNLSKDSGLKPGDLVNLSISYDSLNDVVLLPMIYVEIDENTQKSYVYKLDSNNVVQKVEVVLGKTNNIYYEVKSGLNSGDKIIDNIMKLYKEGDKIQ